MKTIIRIAKLELSTLFYSPIAWLLLIIFTFQAANSYVGMMEAYEARQQLTELENGFLTDTFFGFPRGLLYAMKNYLYFYIPLLTMGLMSREKSSGTIKLLYSSPVKMREIVLGKFTAMAFYCFLLIVILFLFVISALFHIDNLDLAQVLSGLLGLFLVLCAYSAIGLFISCLTSYQVVAAIATLAAFAVLSNLGNVWQGIDFIRDLTFYLSINFRAENMIAGLITTRELFYFVTIIGMFLTFATIKLQTGRKTLPLYTKIGTYALVIVVGLLITYTSSRPGLIGYLDTTRTKARTLSEASIEIVKELEAPLEVTSYINLFDDYFHYGKPEQRNQDMARWERYLRFKPDIELNYVYYYDSVPTSSWIYKENPNSTLDEIAKKHAKSAKMDLDRFKTPEEIREIIDLRPESNRYVMHLKYKERETFLRLFNDSGIFPGEEETSAAFKRLTQPEKLPKVAFLTDEFERSILRVDTKDYNVFTSLKEYRKALINQGFDVDTLSLKNQDVPDDVSILVIADPRKDFEQGIVSKIEEYIAKGGNMIIAGEPGKQSVLNPLLENLGVALMEGILVEAHEKFSADLIMPYPTETTAGLSRALDQAYENFYRAAMPSATGLTHETNGDFTITPLLETDDYVTWLRKEELVLDSTVVYSPEIGDQKVMVPTLLSLTRNVGGKEQRIIVSGDADFLSNAEARGRWLGGSERSINGDLNFALFSWLCYDQFPIDAYRTPPTDKKLNITDSGVSALKWVFMGILPGLLLLSGTVLLIRRKRK